MSAHQLEGATAIVTGASRGFGRAIATSLVDHGAQVVGVARSEPELNQLRHQLGERFEVEVADATDHSLPDQLITRCRPQLVVLNAGATPPIGPLDQQTWESFSANWHSDVRQVFNFAKASLTAPLAPGSLVITVSSAAALRGSPMSGGYAGAKATTRFISAYAGDEATRRSLGLRFVTVLPQLTPGTALGAAGVAAYAERAGLSIEAFQDQLRPVLTPEHLAKTITDIATGGSYPADAYLLTATDIRPLD
ncbi:MAG: SDR family oxidoreductase [Acidimicrobiaceae bacterium]|nr:SDR family oxidoreductase [Acidimicrobiaceae bacterium]